MAARLRVFVPLLSGVRRALEKQQIHRSEEQRRWGEESGGKKLTALIWNQKEIAAWQSLKSCTCTFIKPALRCASLAPTLSFCFTLHVLRLAALSFSACFPFALHRVLCVNCGHPWGRRERWGEPVLDPPCQVVWYDSARSYRHLVCLKGRRKVDLASSLLSPHALSLLPIRPLSFSLSSPLTLFFSQSLLSSSWWKQLLYSQHTGILCNQPGLSHQSWQNAHHCLQGGTSNFLGQWLWN